MRIADTAINNQFLNTQLQNNLKLNKVTEQIGTQSSINRFSDDPIAAAKLESVEKQMKINEQYITNGNNVKDALGKYETHAETLVSISNEINELLLQGSNQTLDAEGRKGIVNEINSLKDEMLTIFNKQEDGRYIFSGSNTRTPAIQYTEEGGYTIGSNGEQQNTVIGENSTIQSNVTVQNMLTSVDFLNDIDAAVLEMSNESSEYSATLEAAIDSTQTAISDLQTGWSNLGNRLNTVDRQIATSEDLNLFSENVRLELTAVDNAQASFELTQTKAAIEMSQKAFTFIHNTNMFDLI